MIEALQKKPFSDINYFGGEKFLIRNVRFF